MAGFGTLELQRGQFLALEAQSSMGRIAGECFPPDASPEFLRKVLPGTWEALPMSALAGWDNCPAFTWGRSA